MIFILHVPFKLLFIGCILQYFQGNRDQHSLVCNVLNPPVIARFMRIIPRGWYRHISMRIEFYGCKAGKIGKKNMTSKLLCIDYITLSRVVLGSMASRWDGRLNSHLFYLEKRRFKFNRLIKVFKRD